MIAMSLSANMILGHLSGLIKRLLTRCQSEASRDDNSPLGYGNGSTSSWIKRRRKFAKYSMQANECGNDIRTLIHFIDAQTIAFRKILKKYRVSRGRYVADHPAVS